MGGALGIFRSDRPRFACADRDWPENFPPIPTNRFQKSGNTAVYEVKETNEACIMKVDMPGCTATGLSWWARENSLIFFGDEPGSGSFEGRRYGGTLILDSDSYLMTRALVYLEHGVLWITVPKIHGNVPQETSIKVSETMLLLENSTSDAAKKAHGL